MAKKLLPALLIAVVLLCVVGAILDGPDESETPVAQPTATREQPTSALAATAEATPRPRPTSDLNATAQAIEAQLAAIAAPCGVGQIKANTNSGIYHVPGGQFYGRTVENVACFDDAATAEAAGYRASER